MSNKLSVCVLTFNDEHTVEWALSSVQWADEIVVVDTGSTDRTTEIAQSLGARVVKDPGFSGFGETRNRAFETCTHDWVLSLDADEHCTPPLREEITALLAGEPQHDAYFIPRLNFLMGRLIRGSGWYRDHRTPQLFRKSKFRYTAARAHESHELASDCAPGMLKNELLHYPFSNFEEILMKANLYSTLATQSPAPKGASMWGALGHATWTFLRLYIFRYGFIDGWAGFVIAFSNFEGTFYRYAKWYEKEQAWRLPTDHASVHGKS